jgi:hypothetical protein
MMKTKSFIIQAVVYMSIVVLICACSPAQASPTPIPPTTTAEPTDLTANQPVLNITFDGDECIIEGPDTIPRGNVSLIMHNPGDEEYWVAIEDIGEGKTWDDLVAYMGPPGSERSGPPEWTEGTPGLGKALGGQTSEYSTFLLTGEYGLICILPTNIPYRNWMGMPLTVED